MNPRGGAAVTQRSREFTLSRKCQTPSPALQVSIRTRGILSQYPPLCISLITDEVKYILFVYYAFAYLILQSAILPWYPVRWTELCSVPLNH